MVTSGAGRYLGFDLSTQSCKAVVVGEDGKVQHIARVVYDEDLPMYETSGGVHRGDDGRVTSPAEMWCEALELVVKRLADLTDLSDIVAVSGSGQQHATVYLKEQGVTALEALDPARPLQRQFSGCFARESPVWLDTSTGQECAELEEAAGGAMALSALTGSKAYERFSVHLIRQTFGRLGVSWSDCSHIALASSFCASLVAGKRVPIDHSDAAGMNLMDLSTRQWSEKLVDCVGGDLRRVLPEPIPAWTKCGRTAAFWKKYNLEAEAVAWSGDNPCAVVGLGLLEVGDIAISLGTSDTCLAVLPGIPAEALPFGHIFPHPTLEGKFWSMLCYTNGDLMRKQVRDEYADGDWEKFSAMLGDTAPGNDGCFGYFTVTNEITPALAEGEPVFRKNGMPVKPTAAEAVRCAVELRALAVRSHLVRLAPELLAAQGRLLLTGGASANPAIRQVYADIFNRRVSILDTTEAAAVGAALRAMHACGKSVTVDGLQEKEIPQALGSPASKKSKAELPSMALFNEFEAEVIKQRGR